VTNNQNADAMLIGAINHRIGEVDEGKAPAITPGRSAQPGIFDKQFCDALEFIQEASCNAGSGFLFLKSNGFS